LFDNQIGRARWGGSGALYPQPAIAGLNSCLRVWLVGSGLLQGATTVGSCAAETFEPCQVLAEAALRKNLRVPQGRLARATCAGIARKSLFEGGCTASNFSKRAAL